MSEGTDDSALAREGIKLLLNNQFEEAEELFCSENGNVQLAAGYSFLAFMNALMSFEEDKFEESLQILRDVEKRCSQIGGGGWLKSMKSKVFNSFSYSEQELVEKLEEQIILADSQVCLALLTFLQQDLTSYVRGSWVLRKAWKVYQNAYTQTLSLYKKTFGCDAPIAVPSSYKAITKSASDSSLMSESAKASKEWSVPNSPSSFNGLKSQLSHNNSLSFSNNNNKDIVKPEVVARLMAAVSFGYGIFHLCISLLPSSLLRLIHFLGFEGDKNVGLSALMFSREGNDMRSPLATLALLWYHTIVRPFFALDGSNVQAGVDEADLLINESQAEFGSSALFLYFKGKVQRLKSNIPQALEAFESAIDKSNQREIQLLCLHEIGWCYLIQLDWGNAFHCFNQLRSRSKWSRSFYTYLTMVCIGACGDVNYSVSLAQEIPNLLRESNGEAPIEAFINKRIKKFPLTKSKPGQSDQGEENYLFEKLSCELFILELLYFWNALPSCNPSDLQKSLNDFQFHKIDPMPGLIDLIEGAIHLCKPDYEKALAAFDECLRKRRNSVKSEKDDDPEGNDHHISAFAMFEKATILLRNSETSEEGKQLLVKIQNDFRGYDFENRLSIRIHSILKSQVE